MHFDAVEINKNSVRIGSRVGFQAYFYFLSSPEN